MLAMFVYIKYGYTLTLLRNSSSEDITRNPSFADLLEEDLRALTFGFCISFLSMFLAIPIISSFLKTKQNNKSTCNSSN